LPLLRGSAVASATSGLAACQQSMYTIYILEARVLLEAQLCKTQTRLTSLAFLFPWPNERQLTARQMVRAKPSLFLTVPNALDAHSYSRADLITPPCYIVSAPPPVITPALSRSSSLSTNSSPSESDCEFEGDDEEISLRTDAAPWTIDQDEALLSVPPSLFVLSN
jgi:hypothetical protein